MQIARVSKKSIITVPVPYPSCVAGLPDRVGESKSAERRDKTKLLVAKDLVASLSRRASCHSEHNLTNQVGSEHELPGIHKQPKTSDRPVSRSRSFSENRSAAIANTPEHVPAPNLAHCGHHLSPWRGDVGGRDGALGMVNRSRSRLILGFVVKQAE